MLKTSVKRVCCYKKSGDFGAVTPRDRLVIVVDDADEDAAEARARGPSIIASAIRVRILGIFFFLLHPIIFLRNANGKYAHETRDR